MGLVLGVIVLCEQGSEMDGGDAWQATSRAGFLCRDDDDHDHN